jgi:hypothetical protein
MGPALPSAWPMGVCIVDPPSATMVISRAGFELALCVCVISRSTTGRFVAFNKHPTSIGVF